MNQAIVVALLLIAALAVYLLVRRRRDGDGAQVTGGPQARAAAAEERSQGIPTDPSPMPEGDYDFWRGETSLIDPVILPRDSLLRDLGRTYATSDPEARGKMRRAISMDELSTLLMFGRRAAVFSIREGTTDWLVPGLSAIAMIESERLEARDIPPTLSVLYHAASSIGANPDQLLRDAARLAESAVETMILEFLGSTARPKDIRAWGYDEVATEGRAGFVWWAFEKFDPTCDMKEIAVEVAALLAADKYQPAPVSLADELPPNWLQPSEEDAAEEAAVERVLGGVRAGAAVSGRLRPGEDPRHEAQRLTVFIVETTDEETGRALLGLSQRASPGHSKVGVWKGKLFCLLVARSLQEGVESFETPQSIQRFSKGLSEVLRRHAGKS